MSSMSHHVSGNLIQPDDFPAPGEWFPVTPDGEQAIAAIVADPGNTLLASDFDGTLSGIVPRPEDAVINPDAREAFATLGGRLGQIAIVTGRPVAAARELGRLDEHDGFSRLVLLGQYSQEQWDAASGELTMPPVPEGVALAREELGELLAAPDAPVDLSGVVLEDKGRAIGVHTRRASDPSGALAWLEQPVAKIAEKHGLVVEPGRNVIELRSSSTTKGDGIDALVTRFHPAVLVMMGDDLGDLAAFARIKQLREQGVTGVCVVAASVEQPTVAEQADVLCGGPEGIAAWMQELIRALDKAS
ncbi:MULTISPECIES: trehalose-phosphatase [unclassified Luteococcus]|uniref:trehalose-phosphatase n=1 Tax=unclassified Luteococcus TaxID=2639923 RepID=UPI00313B7EAF